MARINHVSREEECERNVLNLGMSWSGECCDAKAEGLRMLSVQLKPSEWYVRHLPLWTGVLMKMEPVVTLDRQRNVENNVGEREPTLRRSFRVA
jgi:hypothetical protein